jgi:CheY-like chemotaxis protein
MAKVLIIDDDPALRRLLGRVLAGAGHEVIEAADGTIGTQLFRQHQPALVVTDLIMPNHDGIETIREIRKLAPGARIIAISGGGMGQFPHYLEFARGLGADAALAKPFKPEELLALIDTLLGQFDSLASDRP